MHTVTLRINNANALKTLRGLEDKHFISIIDSSDTDLPSLPGAPLSLNEFKTCIKDAGQAPTVSLSEAKERWQQKRKQLQQLIK